MAKPIQKGDRGIRVKELQEALIREGILKGTADGDFGPKTDAAVRAFQRKKGMVADGIVGDRTKAALLLMRGHTSEVPSFALTEADLKSAARSLGVPLAAIKAVSEVESAGFGFLDEGIPKVLYERHWMYRYCTQKKYRDTINLNSTFAALVGRDGMDNFINKTPGGYRGGKNEWKRFKSAAAKIHEAAAICSTSFGRYQIMGFHWQGLGYKSPKAFFDAMCVSEGEQLKAFVKFIKNDTKMHAALKNLAWKDFAKRYNGTNYKVNSYDIKLAVAYDRHS